MGKKAALGRGLGALIDDSKYEAKKVEMTSAVNEVELSQIDLNPFQPRKQFDQESLDELSSSIQKLGIIQPVTLRKLLDEDRYQLISGERRFRAAKQAGLQSIPAFIREADDQALLELALVENIQREDLNAIEVALSYQRLIEECSLTQDKMSERVGKKRSTIANYLRLLKLPAEIQIGIRDRKISMGHARALVNIEDPKKQINLFFKIINEGLSVRKIEVLVREINNPPADTEKDDQKEAQKKVSLPEEFKGIRKSLSKVFNTKIELKRDDAGKGRIVIPFSSDDELQHIAELLNKLKS